MSLRLNSTDFEKEIEKLRVEIERHNRLYYMEAMPEISDRDYDALLQRLEDVEKKFPDLVTPDSPTQRVGGEPLKEFVSVQHKIPMLSLQNADAKKPSKLDVYVVGVIESLRGEEACFVLEPKIDGISIALRYEDGVLTQAVTRGDGIWGDDVTANIKTIHSIPLKLHGDAPEILEVRGEVYMGINGFAQFNAERKEKGLNAFANPRNACAGTMKLLNPKEVVKRPLDAIFYGTGELQGIDFQTHEELIDALSNMGLTTSPMYWICSTLDEIRQRLGELDKMRNTFDFAIDGCVIKLNQRNYYAKMGYRSKSPKWAIAYKYEPEQVKTKLLDIQIQVGRSGVLTPVAKLEPVHLAGTMVKRATLHNGDEIIRKKIKIGDRVLIEKAGEIIPVVVKALIKERMGTEIDFTMPTVCPACGGEIEKRKDEVALRCINLQCPAQLKSWLEHFSSRGALDIEGIGGIVADKLVDSAQIVNPLHLFKLKKTELAMLNLGSSNDSRLLGRKNAAKIIHALEKAKSKSFGKWLFALGIPRIGAISAQNIARIHSDPDEIGLSKILREFVELFDLQEEMGRINPLSKNDPCKTSEERSRRETRVDLINERIAEIIGPLFDLSWIKQVDNEKKKIKPSPICLEHQYSKTNHAPNPEAVHSLLNYIRSDTGLTIWKQFQALHISFNGKQTGTSLLNKRFVLTGSLNALSRNEAQECIANLGGAISETLSKNTDYVIVGDKAGTKLKKAQNLGITVLDEESFFKLIQFTPTSNPESKQLEFF